MNITNIIIRENENDTFALQQVQGQQYVSFDIGSTSQLVSSNVWEVLNKYKAVPSGLMADLLDFAIAVYTTDQIVSRKKAGFQNWSRHFQIYFPVSEPARWDKVKSDLEQMLSFLSGDKWYIFFRKRETSRDLQQPLHRNPDGITKVSLLSGGLDSFIGAVDLLEVHEKVAFVSHYKRGAESPKQGEIYAALRTQYPANGFKDFKFYVQPLQSNTSASKEDTSRARSFLFLTLGITLANSFDDNIELIIPENGLISLNVPLTNTRLSSHSTRTTHPFYLSLYQKVLSGIGVQNKMVNPYRFNTKGEMMLSCANQAFLKNNYVGTLSCSHSETSRFVKGAKPGIHCGYCVPCIIRQASEKAFGGIRTTYAHQIKSTPPSSLSKKGRDLRAFKMAITEISMLAKHSLVLRVLKSGPLPFESQQELDNYLNVYLKGMKEVNNFLQ